MLVETQVKTKTEKRSWKVLPIDKVFVVDSMEHAKLVIKEHYFSNPEIESVRIMQKGKFNGICISRHILQECH
jgi:hypothetical protein